MFRTPVPRTHASSYRACICHITPPSYIHTHSHITVSEVGITYASSVQVINPGAHGTNLLHTSIHAFFSDHIDRGSLWTPALKRARDFAQRYMTRNARDPDCVAQTVAHALLSRRPKNRYLVNTSWDMWFMRWTPQW
eukprot:m.390552 g.390552  ORF g.390552 m.390552 type:complete len:137 (-) comp21061_c0_seq11:279-689(-)